MNMYLHRNDYQSAYGSLFDAYAEDPSKKEGFVKLKSAITTKVTVTTILLQNNSEESKALTFLQAGESVTITWLSNDWAYCKAGKNKGYILKNELEVLKAGMAKSGVEEEATYANYKSAYEVMFDDDLFYITILGVKNEKNLHSGYRLLINAKNGDYPINDTFFFAGVSAPPVPVSITDGAIVFSTGDEVNTYMLFDHVEILNSGGEKFKRHTFGLSFLRDKEPINYPDYASIRIPLSKKHSGIPYIPDIPGNFHDAVGDIIKGLYVRFDSNGDQTKDMLMIMKLKTASPKNKHGKHNTDMERPYDSILFTLKSYDTGEIFETEIRPQIFNQYLVGNNFNTKHIQRTDGITSNLWELSGLLKETLLSSPPAPGEQPEETTAYNLTIDSPVKEGDKLMYNINFAGYSTKAYFNAEKTKYNQTVSGASPVQGLSKMALDLTLGAYKDKMRLVLEPIEGSEKYSRLYAFMYINEQEVAAAQTTGSKNEKPKPYQSLVLKIAPPYTFSVIENADKTDNLALRLDLNNDNKEDLVIYDRVIAGVDFINEKHANNARQHWVHLKGESLDPKNAILMFSMQLGSMKRNEDEPRNEDTFQKYMKFFLPGDFDKEKVPGKIDAFLDAQTTIAQVTALRKAWKEVLKNDVPFTNRLDETWNKFVVSAYALLPLKKADSPQSDAARETTFKNAVKDFYAAFDEEITAAHKEHSPLWKLFKGFTLREPDEDLLDNISGASWEEVYEQLMYYAQRYADWAAEVMQEAGEKARERDEENGGVFITNRETQQATYAKAFSQRMKAFEKIKGKPGLQQVRAVHYPKDYTYNSPEGKNLHVSHVPLDIYYWKEDDTWYVFDLTNPNDTYKQDADVEQGQTQPPQALFELLNKSGHFAEGYMVVELPDGSSYQVATHTEHDAGYYATYIAFALLAAGLALTGIGAPASALMLAGEIALAAADVAFVVSGAMRLQDLAAHDKLTFSNVALEVGNIVLSGSAALARVPGKILSVAAKSEGLIFGNMVPLIKASKVSYIALHNAQRLGGGMVVLALQVEVIEQLASLKGKGSAEDIARAGQAIMYQLMAAGMVRAFRLSGSEALEAAQEGKNLMLIEIEGRPCFVPANAALEELLIGLKGSEKLSAKAMTQLLKRSDAEITQLRGKTVEEIERILKRFYNHDKPGEFSLKKIAYGVDDLSKLAINYRIEKNIWHDANIAVCEYIDDSGNLLIILRESERGKRHAELIIIDFIESQGINKNNILRLYSELEPCMLPEHQCKSLLSEKIPNAEVTFSFDYPGSTAAETAMRAAGRNERQNAFKDIKQKNNIK